jgi:hypothetical protein
MWLGPAGLVYRLDWLAKDIEGLMGIAVPVILKLPSLAGRCALISG